MLPSDPEDVGAPEDGSLFDELPPFDELSLPDELPPRDELFSFEDTAADDECLDDTLPLGIVPFFEELPPAEPPACDTEPPDCLLESAEVLPSLESEELPFSAPLSVSEETLPDRELPFPKMKNVWRQPQSIAVSIPVIISTDARYLILIFTLPRLFSFISPQALFIPCRQPQQSDLSKP